MVGQLVVEDEYTINVKLRRPLTNGSCLPPPTITITPDDPTITVLPPPNTSLTHAQAAKSVNGAPPMVVGCSTTPPRPKDNDGLRWRRSKVNNNNSMKTSGTYQRSIMPPSPPPPQPPPPPVRRTYQEEYVPEDKVTHGCLRLPLVQVFSDDNDLVATNKFSTPLEPSSSSLPHSSCNVQSSHALAPPPQEEYLNPTAPGALYVERIPAHCKSDCGVLYVPPVDERHLRRDKRDEPPAKGNSRRNRLPRDDGTAIQGQDIGQVKVVEVAAPSVPAKRAPPEQVPPRSSSSKAAARAYLAEVLSPRIETRVEPRPPSPRPPLPRNFNFYNNNNNNNNNIRGRLNRKPYLADQKNDDDISINKNKRSTALLNFSVSQENKKNASHKNGNIPSSFRNATSFSSINNNTSANYNNRFVINSNNKVSNGQCDFDNDFLSPLEDCGTREGSVARMATRE